ncbi:hypothetical protein PVAND_012091 [Polypedilum vanderplanki]|uniref:1-acylglycerol-3-phosphate O-acyltransferase n=1 Tax=Polypedilum vanderplanki TaxID=319348 RepID=A0A9J6CMC5_POLVA|nr:hypothetical protein PVAND_012091 [Polypedilum vanderplanki]
MFLIILTLLIISTILYKNNHVFKYNVKYLFYILASSILGTLSIPYLMLRPRNPINFRGVCKMFRLMSPVLGLSYELRGINNLEKDYACVIASNHQSSLDFLCMYEIWYAMRRHPIFRVTAVARMLLLFAGPYGIGAWLSGLIFINKDSPDRGIKKMNESMEYLKKNKIHLWMYVEGYRNHSGKIDEFKKGAFRLAIQSQVPIIPLVISSYNYFLDPKKMIFNSGKIIIEVLPEIPTKGLKLSDLDTLMEKTRNVMVKKFDELNNELRLNNNLK